LVWTIRNSFLDECSGCGASDCLLNEVVEVAMFLLRNGAREFAGQFNSRDSAVLLPAVVHPDHVNSLCRHAHSPAPILVAIDASQLSMQRRSCQVSAALIARASTKRIDAADIQARAKWATQCVT